MYIPIYMVLGMEDANHQLTNNVFEATNFILRFVVNLHLKIWDCTKPIEYK